MPSTTTQTATRSVLLVDDSAVYRRGLQRAVCADPRLTVAGEAADGAVGLQEILRLEPDVVALDLHMPVMDGMELCRRLHAEPPALRPRLVLVSAMLDRETIELATRYGVDACADKALTRPEICNVLAGHR